MNGNTVSRRFQITDLVIAAITAVSTATVSVAVTSGGLQVGAGVLVTPRSALTNGIAVYGHVIDATHIGIDFVNASAGSIDPADTFDFDVFVFNSTGNVQA